jgi:hypothetical protein
MPIERHRAAVLVFATIKAAVEDFDSGESNLVDALERISLALAMLARDEEPRREAA